MPRLPSLRSIKTAGLMVLPKALGKLLWKPLYMTFPSALEEEVIHEVDIFKEEGLVTPEG